MSTSTQKDIAFVVVGTAGHIDHGKSALVRRLTGHDPDRLPEEQARGITIDLGYAVRELPDGRILGFIDVPGHERFIKNMVAGATGVDVTILVVAADDGVMPQTREHLSILELLGMDHLLVALTKCDLVDEEMIELATEDVRNFLEETVFADCPILPCSAITGAGCDEIWAKVIEMLDGVESRSRDGIFRMPIQRVFSVKGFGTVVTGVPLSGSVAVGDAVQVLPADESGKVRGLQAYEKTLERAGAGHRTAVNISDVDWKEVERGMVVSTPGVLRASHHVAVRLRALPGLEDEISDGDEVRFHTGTAEVLGEVAVLEGKAVQPGESALVQIVLHDPVVAVPGDRFILRRHSPMLTLGGGTVLRLDERRLKRRRDWILSDLARREEAVGDAEAMTSYLLSQGEETSVTAADLVREAAVGLRQARALLAARVATNESIELGPDRFVSAAALEAARGVVADRVERFHSEHPECYRLDVAVLRRELPYDDPILDRCLADLVAAEQVVVERGTCRLAEMPPPDPELEGERSRIADLYLERTFDSPRPGPLAEELGLPPDRVALHLQYLADSGRLVKIGDHLHLHQDTVRETLEKLRTVIADSGEVDTNEFKNLLGVSRKLLIPLLEYFDSIAVTIRDGNKRFLRSARSSS